MPNSRSPDLYSGVDPDVERSKSFADAELKAYWELVQGRERSDFLEHGNRVVGTEWCKLLNHGVKVRGDVV